VGAKSPEQVYHNARAADWRLTESDLAELDEVQGDLHLSDPSW
jgi:aryl-alcohol dehydrogenase-like predicted oxidoreductase